jgi:hypothetical protein
MKFELTPYEADRIITAIERLAEAVEKIATYFEKLPPQL